ncbi:MAG: HAMP domain-containing histidine kinase [Flavobacteriales bacterium]|nr:HAMP domain-containing histidine kinase [Bacteroidota bacterium]MCB9241424.1 HAMP domain-containing histidine kinase [Flavobacteriales bacterium]
MNSFQIRTWIKYALLGLAASIIAVSLVYTDNLVERLKEEERVKVNSWAEATRIIVSVDLDKQEDISYPLSIVSANTTIPVIAVMDDAIITHRNLDSTKSNDKAYLLAKIEEMKSENEPIITEYEGGQLTFYYENSILYTKLKYYPYVQLTIIALFLLVSYMAFSYSRKSEQNQVWVGMSKETAHQLGTPISSLLAWMELLKQNDGPVSDELLFEMQRDLSRLELITERFSKIGSEPVLEEHNVHDVVVETVQYLQKRLPSRVSFVIEDCQEDLIRQINVPLFAWVIENLTKNAVDAMNGEGEMRYECGWKDNWVYIDISDTGKGIPGNRFSTIFEPGFTTKKRGWGLGLSLAKRIIDNYHRGSIYVKESIPNKRTTFRILLKQ